MIWHIHQYAHPVAVTTERAGPSRATTSERVRWCIAVALAYYVLALLGLELSLVADSVTPLWPPTGIAVRADQDRQVFHSFSLRRYRW